MARADGRRARPALSGVWLPCRIGARYALSGAPGGFASTLSALSLAGLFLGVLLLVVVSAVMNGFSTELRERILSAVPHGYIDAADRRLDDWPRLAVEVESHEDVLAAAPYLAGDAMLFANGRVHGVELNAVLPARERRVSEVLDRVRDGDAGLVAGEYRILLGELLADTLRVGVGDAVNVVLPKLDASLAGVFPRMRRFHVSGIFSVGANLDANLALVHLDDGARLYRQPGTAHGLRVRVADLLSADRTMAELARSLPADGRYVAKDWGMLHSELFRAVRMEKAMMTAMMMAVVAVAAFNIVALLTMTVERKRAAIAVLRTLGMRPVGVMAVFVSQGMLLGALGVAAGLLAGLPLAVHVGAVVAFAERMLGAQVFDAATYFITAIPSDLRWQDVAATVVGVLSLCWLATLYPAWRAARVPPAEALHSA